MKGHHTVVPFVAIVALMTILSLCDGRPLRRDTTRELGKEGLMIGKTDSKMKKMMKDEATSVSQEAAAFSHLMGVELDDDDEEGCGGERKDDDDEECMMKRRRMAEAHLDYIYTQHHNHP